MPVNGHKVELEPDASLEASDRKGTQLFNQFLDNFPEMEQEGLDPVAVAFRFWIGGIYLFIEGGWTPEELHEAVAFYSADAILKTRAEEDAQMRGG